MIQAAGDNLVKMTHDLCSKMYEDKKCSQRLGKSDYCATTQENDKRECSNYRSTSLLSLPGKVYTKMLQQRFKGYVSRGTGSI